MAAVVAGAIASGLIKVVCGKAATAILEEIGLLWGLSEELDKLVGALSMIHAHLEAAEERQLKDKAVAVWLHMLKEVAYDADDLLDEMIVSRTKDSGRGGMRQVRHSFLFSASTSTGSNSVMSRRKVANRLKKINERLDEIAKRRGSLGLQVSGGERRLVETTNRRETSSLLKDDVFGREVDRENTIRLLLSDGESGGGNVSVVPIVGAGGVGKTTLAQLIYNDDKVVARFPQLRKWVFVSENFDTERLIKRITGSSLMVPLGLLSLENLHGELMMLVKGKRFLIVLDDVWIEDRDEWEKLWLPLACGGKGSKVVVTTRSQEVIRIMHASFSYRLQGLSDDDCWWFFKKCAFADGDSDRHPNLEAIGREIAGKLKGSPLAAKTIGGLLYSKLDEIDWRNILESEIWELPQNENGILPALRLSYQHLPTHLKQCFVYCSIFPKNYTFDKTEIVQIWMAQGFIQPQGRKQMEDLGSDYFDDLLGRSFFQIVEGKYMMHDLIHDLAHSISADECFRIDDVMACKIPEKTRHLSLFPDKWKATEFKNLYKLNSLRTLLFMRRRYYTLNCVPFELFRNLKYLRALDLSRGSIQNLPDSIGNLKHLRYLDLSFTKIETLPESLCKLFNIETLKLNQCTKLRELPKGMNNLINLRHLEARTQLVSMIYGIGKMTSLQKLGLFNVQKKSGHMIEELKGMAGLRELHISMLENVLNGTDAREAELNNKEQLHMLRLEWDFFRGNNMLDEEVLEGLQPHYSLKELSIKCYKGVRSPNWMKRLSNIETISISECLNWEEWLVEKGMQIFPYLRKLDIQDCPKLREMPPLPPTLRELRIVKVGLSALPDLQGSCGGTSQLSLSLSYVEISQCPKLTSLSEGLLGSHHLRALETLTIRDCEELVSLPQQVWFGALVSLKSLEIQTCPKVTSLPEIGSLPSSLQYLKIRRCPYNVNADSLLIGLPHLTALETLDIFGVYHYDSVGYKYDRVEYEFNRLQISMLPVLTVTSLFMCLQSLTSLRSLTISDCPDITSLPGEVLHHLTALEELEFHRCECLTSLGLQALNSLKHLKIGWCPRLVSLTESVSLPTSLVDPEIIWRLGLQDLTSLTSLSMSGFKNLTCLPGQVLCHLTALEKLEITSCSELTSLGIQALVSIKHLTILSCRKLTLSSSSMEDEEGKGLPLLEYLKIDSASLVEWLLLQNLTSLRDLRIHKCPTICFGMQEGWQSLTSLQQLHFFGCDFYCLPTELHRLPFLQELHIWRCPNIMGLPKKGLPVSLQYLFISECPKLEKQCQENGGRDWPKIANIPSIAIDVEK